MKSLLIIGTPKNCGDCPCAGEEFGICQADEKNRDCDWYKIPSWCPLRPLPSFKAVDLNDTRDVVMFCHGWNTCLAEIAGEEE